MKVILPPAGEGECIPELKSWLQQLARKIKFYKFLYQYLTKKSWFTFKHRFPALSDWYTKHFPAINLKRKLDSWDYFLNFSSELMVIGLALLVVVFTFAAFGSPFSSSKEHDFSDNSLAGRLLSYHISLNTQLYNKQNAIKTTIVTADSFIPSALASNEALSSNDSTPTDSSSGDATSTTDQSVVDNTIVESSPDTVRGLINNQIIEYTTVPGDTIWTLAKKFNLSIETIKQVNHLPSNDVKPGWQMRFIPVDGVLYKIAGNDTGPDIAKYFGVPLDRIVAYNGLESDLDFEPGQEIIIPGGKIPAPVAPPTPKKGKVTVPADAIPRNGLYAEGHTFVAGQCTDYVARVYAAEGDPIPWGSNAKDWDTAAAPYAIVNHTPTIGSIIQFEAGHGHSRYGHVGVVESIEGSSVTYSEWNGAGGPFHKTFSSAPISSAKFIHYKGH